MPLLGMLVLTLPEIYLVFLRNESFIFGMQIKPPMGDIALFTITINTGPYTI